MLRTMLFGAMLSLLAAPAFAQLAVGDDGVDISPRNWINPPTWQSFSELKGDVVLIKAWGKN